jgi:hypothetical protein
MGLIAGGTQRPVGNLEGKHVRKSLARMAGSVRTPSNAS